MAEFTEHMQRFRPAHESFTDMDMDIQILKQHQQLLELYPSTLVGSFSVTDFSLDSFFAHQQQADRFSSAPDYVHNKSLSNTFHHPDIFSPGPTVHPVASTSSGNVFPDARKKRKAEAQSTSSSKNVSPSASTTSTKKKNNVGRGQKGKDKEKEVDKAEEVIHVRAKRGQATDSHSIAERVRREKINHKLRCLQDLVPGCHKSMGMAVMLEEIINYVHSLQNQVEFLSMELAAASCSHDLNLETESSKKAQGTNSAGAQEMQKLLRERYEELDSFQSTWSI